MEGKRTDRDHRSTSRSDVLFNGAWQEGGKALKMNGVGIQLDFLDCPKMDDSPKLGPSRRREGDRQAKEREG